MLQLIAGLEVPEGGEIRVDETIIAGDGAFLPPEKREIGIVPLPITQAAYQRVKAVVSLEISAFRIPF